MKIKIVIALMTITVIISAFSKPAIINAPKDTFDQFIKAQNQHDLVLLNNLLLDSQDFLWITKGLPIWGKDQALKRFDNLFRGTWILDPDLASLKIITLDKNSRQIFIPITFSIGEHGMEPKKSRFLMNMIMVKKSGLWKIATILPIQTAN